MECLDTTFYVKCKDKKKCEYINGSECVLLHIIELQYELAKYASYERENKK